ncbi:MAG: glycosyltransferase family protein [Pseudolabrys sp.]
MLESQIRLLVGYARYTDRLSYYDDWLDAFRRFPEFSLREFNIAEQGREAELKRLLDEVDAVVLLHSTNGDTTVYLEPYAATLAARRVPLLTFVGNEVNLPGSPISEKRRVLGLFRPDWLGTQLLVEAGEYYFGDVVARRVVALPHALNPDVFVATRPLEERPIDIGARLSRYLPHLGDNDRNRVADAFRRLGPEQGLAVDISDTFYDRDGWVDFLNRCKGTVSSESGTWFPERDDATVNAVRAYVLDRTKGFVIPNDSALRTFGHKLPAWLKRALRRVLGSGPLRHEAVVNESASFDDIHTRFFANRPRSSVYGKCISSRHFDAIGTKTCQIMLCGRYNDILRADEHYLALNDDLSNIPAVIERFRDPSVRRNIAETAHGFVMAHHTYAHRMQTIAALLRS